MRETAGALGTAVAYAVGVVASDESIQRRVETVLDPEMFQVAPFASLGELAAMAIQSPIDVVVVAYDFSLLKPSGELRTLRSATPDLLVVAISSATGRQAVRKALRAGVAGYVYEAELETALPPTLRAVVAGQVCVPADVRAQLDKPAFSFREKQVLELAARGLTNGEIAQRLFLSESTVKSHLSSSFRKLDVRSRAEAAAIVLDPEHRMELGLFVVPGDGRDGAREYVS